MVAFYRALGFDVEELDAVVCVHAGAQMINFHRPELWPREAFTLRRPRRSRRAATCASCGTAPSTPSRRWRSARVDVEEGPVERVGGRRERRLERLRARSRRQPARVHGLSRRRGVMTHPFSYRDRRVVVTGGSRGVGAALLDVLAELDVAHVTVLDLDPPGGPHDEFVAIDLGDEHAVRPRSGRSTGPVHALFNNAGVADTQPPRRRALGQLPRAPHAVGGTARPHARGRRDRQHGVDRREPVAQARRRDRRGARPRCRPTGGSRRRQWFDEHAAALGQGPYNFSKEVVERYTMRSSRPTMRARCAHERGLPGPDRHAAAARLPRHHQRPDRRLEHPRDGRPTGLAGRGRGDTRVPRLAGRELRQRRQRRRSTAASSPRSPPARSTTAGAGERRG